MVELLLVEVDDDDAFRAAVSVLLEELHEVATRSGFDDVREEPTTELGLLRRSPRDRSSNAGWSRAQSTPIGS
ncbi:MAG: hypothetical protein GY708_17595 [Actinomycetia bacterium]|nr:hypothetical protein [Actinomycetes bacterium]